MPVNEYGHVVAKPRDVFGDVGKAMLRGYVKMKAGDIKSRAKAFLHAVARRGKQFVGPLLRAVGVPSMAQGGMVEAPPRRGKLVLLHNGEMVVPQRKVRPLLNMVHKYNSEMALPISRTGTKPKSYQDTMRTLARMTSKK